jgi:signal transduction histidine kinase
VTRRLLLGLLAFTAIVLALLVIPLGWSGQQAEREQLAGRLERDSMAAASIAVELLRADPDSGTDDPRAAALRSRITDYARMTGGRVVVVDADGRSIVDTGEAGRAVTLDRDFSSRPEVAAALEGTIESGERGSDTLGHPLLFVAAPIASSGELLGAVRISHPASELDRRIRRRWTTLASTSLAVLGIASLAALLVAGWIARPLRDIAGTAERVRRGDLSARADTSLGPPEVRAVAARLNESVGAVERMIEDQRDFTADASHQLRTPLHALMLRLDNAAHELAGGDSNAAAADIDQAASDVVRMSGLVESLLVLERADRDAAGAIERIDLAGIVESRSSDWLERARARGIELQVEVPGPLWAMARELHVEQVLDNYVENALSVLDAGGVIRVSGGSHGNMVELHVVDDGPGLDDEQMELVFRRFHSGADRPRGGGDGGFGLGLAIVRRLAQLDGGRTELRRVEPHGIDAVVIYETPATDESSDRVDPSDA